MKPQISRLFLSALLLVLVTTGSAAIAQTPGDRLWTDTAEPTLASGAQRDIVPARYRTVRLDEWTLQQTLSAAPLEGDAASLAAGTVLSLPLPDGSFGRFQIVESPIMEPGLAAKFPEIRTYRGQGIDDRSATVRLDRTPAGFHAMILSHEGDVYIDPYSREDTAHYISYRAGDARRAGKPFQCGVRTIDSPAGKSLPPVSKATSGSTLRTYRLAVAATGEYTTFHGGTVAQGQAAIVTSMNRVNGIYERDVAIRMVLVANNDQVVYTNSGSDPYSNNNGSTMLGQNQSNLDSVIGNSNYDIGHVFSTGGGGIASLRSPCVTGSKARGVTGQPTPTGDPFWVDYVAHEMGHQWGGNHTFNGNAGSCAGGNRNGSTAYEPGSGTTIQAYAGICGSQNIQSNSDDHFHGISLDEMISYSTTGNGDNCPVRTATGNNPPTVDAGASYTIPLDTPFELCGSATDPDGDSLTYGWEQFDLGSAGAPNSPSGNAPIFRSFSPVTSPCRTFPQLSDLINNTQTLGEILPSYGRTMNFRLTARDNRSGGGGVNDDATTVTASSVGGPFLVTAPNTSVTWSVGTSQNVTWNVAGTDLSPISCSAVDITLSTDGGTTYPITLASGVANSGSASITVPAAPTTSARVKVRCAGNIFFDISNANFTIDGTSGAPPAVTISAPADGSSSEIGDSVTFTGSATDPEDGNISASLSWTSSIDGNIGSGASFSTTSLSLGSHTITASVTDSDGLSGSDVITIGVTPIGGGNGPQNAAYDGGLGAPACAVAGSSCDSTTLLDSRNSLSPAEPNQPNTLDGCTDGGSGSYHADESNDRLVVSTLDGADFAEGATVEISATVWAWTTNTADTLDLYYAADATNPTWVFITSITPPSAGANTLTAQYTLPAGALQAVRANFRYQGSASPCSGGNYDDADDLVFAVNTVAQCTVDADCNDGAFCNGTETCNAGTCQDGTAPDCGDGVSCTVDSCNESTDSCDNTPNDGLCDNGLFCDGSETCDAVNDCQAGTAPNCNDGISCTVDSCNEGSDSCNNAPDDGACSNGLFCDGDEICNPATGCEDGPDPCSGGQTCNETTDICEGGGSACPAGSIDFTSLALTSYSNQNSSNGVAVEDSGDTLHLTGNTWVRSTQTFNVTADTVIEFEFDGTTQGEIHAIGFDENDDLNDAGRHFQFWGTQNWTGTGQIDSPQQYGGGSFESLSVPVGQFYTGNMFLVFTNDDDAASAADSRFRCVRIVEPPPAQCTVDEDFESGSAGWVNDAASTCTTGDYVTGNPTNASGGVQIAGSLSGVSSIFTATNTSAGADDVDGGNCILGSPSWSVTNASTLSVWYWHGQRDAGDDAAGDFFLLEYSTNGGSSWTTMASNGDTASTPTWTNATTAIPAGSNVQVRMQCSDGAGPGDLVECGLDDVSICE